MKIAFVDTQYFIALFQENDQWNERAKDIQPLISDYRFVTTDAILVEVLNYFSGYGEEIRKEISEFTLEVFADDSFQVIEQTRDVFVKGLNLYSSRLDKGYSLTDCISMNLCREMNITEVLTHDHHFEQEGFEILM